MGIPLCLLVFGPGSLPMAVISTLFTACVLFLSAVAMVEFDLQRSASFGRTLSKVLPSLLRNPLLLAPVAGLAVGLPGCPCPSRLSGSRACSAARRRRSPWSASAFSWPRSV